MDKIKKFILKLNLTKITIISLIIVVISMVTFHLLDFKSVVVAVILTVIMLIFNEILLTSLALDENRNKIKENNIFIILLSEPLWIFGNLLLLTRPIVTKLDITNGLDIILITIISFVIAIVSKKKLNK